MATKDGSDTSLQMASTASAGDKDKPNLLILAAYFAAWYALNGKHILRDMCLDTTRYVS